MLKQKVPAKVKKMELEELQLGPFAVAKDTFEGNDEQFDDEGLVDIINQMTAICDEFGVDACKLYADRIC